jgi:Zn-finger nucleic acid-binding protein
MTMACPRCGTSLNPAKHYTGIAWRCTACGGQSLNFSQFRRIIPEARANGIWETAMLEPRAPSRKSPCPECHRDMAAVLIPMPERELEIEVCRNCQRLWLDRQEQIAGHLTANSEPGPLPEARPISVEAQIRLDRQLARRVRRQVTPAEIRWWGSVLVVGIFLLLRYCMRQR